VNADAIKRLLGLEPLPLEGGYYVQTYRSDVALPASALPEPYEGSRRISTAIYYLLTPDTFSALHRLAGDEVYHFYLGDPVELLVLRPDGGGEVVRLGQDLEAGMRVQTVVSGGCWQGSRLAAGGDCALLGTTMAPGFDWQDFEAGDGDGLCSEYPDFEREIRRLVRE
jgi:uncharacterized protein